MTDAVPRPLRLCWDSSVLLGYLNGEPAAAGCLRFIEAISAGRAELLLSTVVVAELLRPKYGEEELRVVDAFFNTSGVRLIPVDVEVARKAADLRAACLAGDPPRKLKTPDALILATALRHADVLYTTDRHLRRLAGGPLAGDLIIAKPPA